MRLKPPDERRNEKHILDLVDDRGELIAEVWDATGQAAHLHETAWTVVHCRSRDGKRRLGKKTTPFGAPLSAPKNKHAIIAFEMLPDGSGF